MVLPDFEAEQWMTDYEQQAVHNLTDSSISALTFEELMVLEPALLKDLRLDYGEITGDHRLKREILSFYRDQNEETLTFANGCLHANKVAMEVLLNEGDHVITIVPGYQQYTNVPLSMGCTVTEIPLEMDTWTVDLNQVRQAIQENTKLIILNNPGNPTGYHLDTAQLQELTEMAREHDLWILSDEVYMLPDEEHPSIADVYEKGLPQDLCPRPWGCRACAWAGSRHRSRSSTISMWDVIIPLFLQVHCGMCWAISPCFIKMS